MTTYTEMSWDSAYQRVVDFATRNGYTTHQVLHRIFRAQDVPDRVLTARSPSGKRTQARLIAMGTAVQMVLDGHAGFTLREMRREAEERDKPDG